MLNQYTFCIGRRFFLVAMCLTFNLHVHAAQLLSFEGKATDPDSSALLYTESHQIILDDAGHYLSAHVSYRYPNGDVFAEKTLDYSKDALAPDLSFYDKRKNEHTYVTVNFESNDLKVLVENAKGKQETNVKLDEPLVVVDAGFDRLIDSQWDTVKKDKELKFSFLAITRAQLINFEVVELTTNETSTFLELHPRNFFINILVDPIALEYDNKTHRLVSFEGLTNIEQFIDGEGTEENYVARIEYSYQPLKPFVPAAISTEITQ